MAAAQLLAVELLRRPTRLWMRTRLQWLLPRTINVERLVLELLVLLARFQPAL